MGEGGGHMSACGGLPTVKKLKGRLVNIGTINGEGGGNGRVR